LGTEKVLSSPKPSLHHDFGAEKFQTLRNGSHHHGFYDNATPEATPTRPMARPPTPKVSGNVWKRNIAMVLGPGPPSKSAVKNFCGDSPDRPYRPIFFEKVFV